VGIWDAARAGDWEKVSALQLKLESLIPFVTYGEVWGGIEVALQELGLCDKITAHPCVPMDDADQIAAVRQLVQTVLRAEDE
jgi:dihydrodipicolinate synthase/N-acetylneuraminate lyase